MLIHQVDNLEKNKKEEQRALDEVIERKTKFLDTTKQDLKKEKESLEVIQGFIRQKVQEIEDLTRVSKELKEFIVKKSEVKVEYLEIKDGLGALKKEYQETIITLQKEKEEVRESQRSLDGTKTYLSDLYGKLVAYTNVAKETLEYVNKHFEKTGTPLIFKIPKGEILEIDIDNFTK